TLSPRLFLRELCGTNTLVCALGFLFSPGCPRYRFCTWVLGFSSSPGAPGAGFAPGSWVSLLPRVPQVPVLHLGLGFLRPLLCSSLCVLCVPISVTSVLPSPLPTSPHRLILLLSFLT